MTTESQDSPSEDCEFAPDKAEPEQNASDTDVETYGIVAPVVVPSWPPSNLEMEEEVAPFRRNKRVRKKRTNRSRTDGTSLSRISDFKPALLDGVNFVRRHFLSVILSAGLPLIVGNVLVYVFAYASLIEFIVSPPIHLKWQGGKIDVGYYVLLSEFRGFEAAIITLVLFSPWIGYRCFEIFAHTIGGYPDPPVVESWISSVALQAVGVTCVIYATALPGFFLGLRGAWWTGATLLIHLVGVAFLSSGLSLFQTRTLKRWSSWLVTFAATATVVGTFVLVKLGMSLVVHEILKRLMDHTIFRSSWLFLLLTIGFTALAWTVLSLFFVALTFVYARLLGQFARSIAEHAFATEAGNS